jgi:hypothetical protein
MFLKTDDAADAWLHEAGETVLFSGVPARNMEPLDIAARSAKAQIKPLSDSAKNIAPRRGDPE